MIIKLPIVILEPGSVILYDTISDAELDLEVIDVTNDLYKGYDADGRLLKIVADNKVVISLAENEPRHRIELENILRDHLTDIGEDVKNLDISALIERSKRFMFISPKNGWTVIKTFVNDLIQEIRYINSRSE